MGRRDASSILIVEDDPDINALLAKIMARAGREPTRAYSGAEALLHLERGSFDLMLLDLMLPGASEESSSRTCAANGGSTCRSSWCRRRRAWRTRWTRSPWGPTTTS